MGRGHQQDPSHNNSIGTEIFIRGGTVQHLHDDNAPTEQLGPSQIIRASHVEPRKGRQASNRHIWVVDLSPIEPLTELCSFETRTRALAAERRWINHRLSFQQIKPIAQKE